jgi:hypothetical protein
VNADADDVIVRLYRDEHLSMSAVAIKSGATLGRVRAVVEREGIGRRRSVEVSDDLTAAIIRSAEQGMTQAQAGAANGVSRLIAGRVLRGQGGLLRPSDAAAVAGITAGQLRDLAVSGAVRYVRSGDDRYRYYRADMERLRHVEALRWAWAGIYMFSLLGDGRLEAWRWDGSFSFTAATVDELRDKVQADWPHYAAGRAS